MRVLLLPLVAVLAFACAHVPDEKERDGAKIHYDLGVNAVEQNRPQEALKEFLEAVRLDPGLAQAHDALGTLYHWSYGRRDDAKAEFEKAVELRPNFSEAWNNLGVLLADMGDVPGSRKAFETALANPLYRTPFIAQANLGWALHLMGDSAQGEALLRAALTSRPSYCMGHKQLAQLLTTSGRTADADASWREFAKACPDEPEALLRLASLQVKETKFADASRSLLRCVEKAGVRPIASDCRSALAQLPPLPDEEPAPESTAKPTDAGQSVGGSRDLGTVP